MAFRIITVLILATAILTSGFMTGDENYSTLAVSKSSKPPSPIEFEVGEQDRRGGGSDSSLNLEFSNTDGPVVSKPRVIPSVMNGAMDPNNMMMNNNGFPGNIAFGQQQPFGQSMGQQQQPFEQPMGQQQQPFGNGMQPGMQSGLQNPQGMQSGLQNPQGMLPNGMQNTPQGMLQNPNGQQPFSQQNPTNSFGITMPNQMGTQDQLGMPNQPGIQTNQFPNGMQYGFGQNNQWGQPNNMNNMNGMLGMDDQDPIGSALVNPPARSFQNSQQWIQDYVQRYNQIKQFIPRQTYDRIAENKRIMAVTLKNILRKIILESGMYLQNEYSGQGFMKYQEARLINLGRLVLPLTVKVFKCGVPINNAFNNNNAFANNNGFGKNPGMSSPFGNNVAFGNNNHAFGNNMGSNNNPMNAFMGNNQQQLNGANSNFVDCASA